jgi:hypothetical protein
MRRQIVALVAAMAMSSASLVMASAQTPPASPSSQPSNTQTITVRGCVNGRSIRTPARPNDRDLLATPPTYRLKGSRVMMDVLKEHDGHEDEITGTTQIADVTKAKVVKEKKVGRGRVYVEAGNDKQPGGIESTEDFTIDVTSIVHVKSTCQVS